MYSSTYCRNPKEGSLIIVSIGAGGGYFTFANCVIDPMQFDPDIHPYIMQQCSKGQVPQMCRIKVKSVFTVRQGKLCNCTIETKAYYRNNSSIEQDYLCVSP